jgi:hypothetical protein
MTQDEARATLKRMVAADTFPTIDGPSIDDLLRAARRPDRQGILDVDVPAADGSTRTAAEGKYPVWQASHAYTAGEVVVPATRNGHAYTVTTPGTSGTGEPYWGTDDGSTTTDGGVTWTETTAVVWFPTYDLNAAAAEGWRWKAARTSDAVTFGTQGDNYNAEQLHTHCLDMARYYEGRVVRTIKVVSQRTLPLDAGRLPRAN